MRSQQSINQEWYIRDNLRQSMATLNLRRMPIVFVITILFSGMNLFFYYGLRICRIGLIGIVFPAVCSAIYLAVYLLRVRNRVTKPTQISVFCVSYWMVFTLSMYPFFADEIALTASNVAPINLLIFFFALSAIPVFSSREIMILFPFLAAFFVVLFVMHGARLYYIITFFFFSASALIISYRNHETYIDTITRLQALSDLDPLTGLFNRVIGYEKLRALVDLCGRHQKLCAVYMLDLDDFKKFNDTYGHVCGDSALVGVAETLRDTFVRQTDVIYRLGGEEFTVCISVSSREHALRLAKNLLTKINELSFENCFVENTNPKITLSAGVVILSPEDEASYDALGAIRAADRELYHAKNNGKNVIFCDGEMVRLNE